MSDAYGGLVVKERPPKIYAVEFIGTNLVNIARWLELHTNLDHPKIEQYAGDSQPQLIIGDQRFCVGDFLVAKDHALSRFSRQNFERVFEIMP